MDYKHTDKTGKKWLLSEMTTAHLINTINLIEKRAVKGIRIEEGGRDINSDFWYDTYILRGDKVLEYLNYDKYINELKKRGSYEIKI